MEICDKLGRDFTMFIYIYLTVDECWLLSSMTQQMFKLHILLKATFSVRCKIFLNFSQ